MPKKKLTFFENGCEIEGREEQHDPMIMAWHYKSSKSEPFAQEEEQTNSSAPEHADLAPLPLPPNTGDGLDENASGEHANEKEQAPKQEKRHSCENAEVKCRFPFQIAGSTLEPRTATRLFSFDLRWPSGTLIKHIEIFDISVERFKQDMDEGLIEGIPRATTDIGGNWLESYNIVWGTQVLQDGQWLSDYDIPLGATLTVLRETQAKSE